MGKLGSYIGLTVYIKDVCGKLGKHIRQASSNSSKSATCGTLHNSLWHLKGVQKQTKKKEICTLWHFGPHLEIYCNT